MIDAALSLLALAACCDLLLQFARVRGWHPADVFQNALYVLFALLRVAGFTTKPTGDCVSSMSEPEPVPERVRAVGGGSRIVSPKVGKGQKARRGQPTQRTESAAANRHEQELHSETFVSIEIAPLPRQLDSLAPLRAACRWRLRRPSARSTA